MNVQKYTAAQLGQMLTHYNRNNGHERNYGNQDIDKTKSKDNYNLGPERSISDIDFVNQRVGEVKHINRKDVVKMATWVITLPKDFEGDSRQFFEKSYNILANRYGQENVISSWVHMDEKTPHMHFAFVPIVHTHDKKGREIEKLSAKEVLTKGELQQMHPFMEKELQQELGEPVHLLNGFTREGNKSIEDLKRGTAIKELDRLQEQTKDMSELLDSQRMASDTLNKELTDKRQELDSLKGVTKGLPEQPQPDGRGLHRGFFTLQAVKDLYVYFRGFWIEARQETDKERERANRAEKTVSQYGMTPQQSHDPDFLKNRAQEIERRDREARERAEEHEKEHTRTKALNIDR